MSVAEPRVSGLVVVDKPGGITSHGVVARVRKLAGTRKVGHAGTLDPMATGVLVLGTNRATRLLGHLMLTRKGYDATVVLGVSTTTDDAEGEVVEVIPAAVDEKTVREAVRAFVGDIEQVPTAVSAIKVDGKRAYARVRDGEEVVLEPRPVTIDSIEVHRVEQVGQTVEVDISVRCSSGTYIRAIARDLGAALEVGGHLGALRRTAVGAFTLEQARTLDELAEEFVQVPIAEAARSTFPAVVLEESEVPGIRFGRGLERALPAQGLHALFTPEGEFLALHENATDASTRAVAVFV